PRGAVHEDAEFPVVAHRAVAGGEGVVLRRPSHDSGPIRPWLAGSLREVTQDLLRNCGTDPRLRGQEVAEQVVQLLRRSAGVEAQIEDEVLVGNSGANELADLGFVVPGRHEGGDLEDDRISVDGGERCRYLPLF